MLRTRKYREVYQKIDTVYGACEEEKKTSEHLILYCKGLHLAVAQVDTNLVQALGFKDTDGSVHVGKGTTKHTLSDLWHKLREELSLLFFLSWGLNLQLNVSRECLAKFSGKPLWVTYPTPPMTLPCPTLLLVPFVQTSLLTVHI